MMQNLSSNFLLEGAILRQAPDRVLLMMGPFHEAASLPCSDHLLLHEFYGDQSLKMIPSWSEEVSLSDFLPFLKEQMELFPRYIQASVSERSLRCLGPILLVQGMRSRNSKPLYVI